MKTISNFIHLLIQTDGTKNNNYLNSMGHRVVATSIMMRGRGAIFLRLYKQKDKYATELTL
jgi:hypothetical protein